MQPAAAPDEKAAEAGDIDRWLAELDAADPAQRDQARRRLLDQGRLDQLQACGAKNLSPAAAAQLRPIVEHLFLTTQKYPAAPAGGFLGLSLDTTADSGMPDRAALLVAGRMPGLSGFAAFEDGDVLLSLLSTENHAEQTPLRGPEDVRREVMRLGAGQTLTVKLLRRGKILSRSLVIDPLPSELAGPGQNDLQAWLEKRRAAADQYWQSHFPVPPLTGAPATKMTTK